MERLPVVQERLMLARRRQRLSQVTLAERTGLFRSDISKYEQGVSVPSVQRLVRLADALGVSLDYLTGRVGEDHGHV